MREKNPQEIPHQPERSREEITIDDVRLYLENQEQQLETELTDLENEPEPEPPLSKNALSLKDAHREYLIEATADMVSILRALSAGDELKAIDKDTDDTRDFTRRTCDLIRALEKNPQD